MKRRQEKFLLYWDWLKIEAAKIKSDGCSKVVDFRKDCCFEHDLAYYYAKDPRSAYNYYRTTAAPDRDRCWHYADPITRREADARIKKCYSDKSILNGLSPFSWTRFLGTRIGGWFAWKNHRRRERKESQNV